MGGRRDRRRAVVRRTRGSATDHLFEQGAVVVSGIAFRQPAPVGNFARPRSRFSASFAGMEMEARRRQAPACCPGVPEVLAADWEAVREQLRARVGDRVFELWLVPLHPHARRPDGSWVLGYPQALRGFLADRFAGVLRASCGTGSLVICDHPPTP